ncbi:MAG: PaaI family thioesterase [Bacteroidales bacterium]|nr:PaaI family thioesterase [Bacteroidales bacterium]
MNLDKFIAMADEVEFLGTTLGMQLVSTPEPDEAMCTLKVTKAVSQPAGFMNGGTSLAVAENLAGIGSSALDTEHFPMGLNVTANHLHAVPIGQTIKAVAKILHQGKTTHVWNVDIFDEEGTLCFTSRVTNYMFSLKK